MKITNTKKIFNENFLNYGITHFILIFVLPILYGTSCVGSDNCTARAYSKALVN